MPRCDGNSPRRPDACPVVTGSPRDALLAGATRGHPRSRAVPRLTIPLINWDPPSHAQSSSCRSRSGHPKTVVTATKTRGDPKPKHKRRGDGGSRPSDNTTRDGAVWGTVHCLPRAPSNVLRYTRTQTMFHVQKRGMFSVRNNGGFPVQNRGESGRPRRWRTAPRQSGVTNSRRSWELGKTARTPPV